MTKIHTLFFCPYLCLLGYAKPQNALAKHVDKEDKGTAPIQGTAYETRVVIINESGLRLFIVLLPGACTPVCGLSPLLAPTLL